MKKTKQNQIILEIITALLIILILPEISAFGATSDYSNQNPLIIKTGETKDVAITIQNLAGNEDITLEAEIISGSEIASITDLSKNYFIPFGKKDVKLNLKLKIPKNPEKDNYFLSVTLKKIPEKSEKNEKILEITNAVTTSFPIIIEKNKTESKFIIPISLIIVITLLIDLYLIFKKKKKSF